jgi:predicted DNA-binding transcriptional regulator AlpA
MQQIPEVGFLRLPQVLAVIPVSRSTWWSWVQSGKAPAGIKLGPRITAWRSEAIREFIERSSAKVSE